MQLAQNSADGQNGRVVENIDWDSLTMRGTCQEVEKRYLRHSSAPYPHTVGETHFLLNKQPFACFYCVCLQALIDCTSCKVKSDVAEQLLIMLIYFE